MGGLDGKVIERLAPRADQEFARRILQGSVLPFFLWLLIAAVTPYRQDHPAVLVTFGGLLLALGVLRAWTWAAYKSLHERRPALWRGLAKAGAYASAALWGTFASLTAALHSQHETMWFTLLVTTGLAAGASVSLAPYPALARHYILIVLGPTVVIGLFEGSLGSYGLAGVVGLYAGFLIAQSQKSSEWFWRAVVKEAEQQAHSSELKERTAYLHALIEASPLAIVVLDAEQRVRLCNPAFERLFQYEQQEIAGRNLDELIQSEESPEETVRLSQQALAGVAVHATTRRRRKDGTLVDVELHGVPLVQNGRLTGLYAIYEDITARRQAEAEIAAANRKLEQQLKELNQLSGEISTLSEMGSFLQSCETVSEACTVVARWAGKLFAEDAGALYLVSASRDTLETAAAWGALAGQETALTPQHCWALRMGQVHAQTPESSEPPCWHAAESGTVSLCAPLMAQGETLGVLHVRRAGEARDPAGWLASRRRLGVSFAEEVALALANLNLREKLQAQSVRDPLTGLFNRRYMEESLERELRRAARREKPLSVLMTDLDHFKRFNDTFGHEAGDVLLRELAKLLRQKVRGEDIGCRYGGEEFAIILPDTGPEDALRRAEQLRAAATQMEVRYQGQELGVITLSIGVASYPLHGSTGESLLRQADRALYAAKAEGRNRVVAAESKPVAQAPAAPVAN